MLSIIIDELISYGAVIAARVQSIEPKKTAHGCRWPQNVGLQDRLGSSGHINKAVKCGAPYYAKLGFVISDQKKKKSKLTESLTDFPAGTNQLAETSTWRVLELD